MSDQWPLQKREVITSMVEHHEDLNLVEAIIKEVIDFDLDIEEVTYFDPNILYEVIDYETHSIDKEVIECRSNYIHERSTVSESTQAEAEARSREASTMQQGPNRDQWPSVRWEVIRDGPIESSSFPVMTDHVFWTPFWSDPDAKLALDCVLFLDLRWSSRMGCACEFLNS